MEKDAIQFLTREYLALWKESGVEDLDLRTLEPRLMARLTERLAQRWPSGPLKSQSPKTRAPLRPSATAVRPVAMRTLEDVRQWLGNCERCGLCMQRKSIVYGSGNPKARLVFVGEGPGAEEDEQGLPFVGRAGELLTKIIEAMGFQRSEVYIANVVKCRPPQNRAPQPDEIQSCAPFLKAQLEVIRPQVVVGLGLYASTALTGRSQQISNLRGQFFPLTWMSEIAVMPTYHPAYLLRNPAAKKLVWEDMKQVKAKLEAST